MQRNVERNKLFVFLFTEAESDQDEEMQEKLEQRRKSLMNEHGNYPIWMSARKVKVLKGKNKKRKKQKKLASGKVTKKARRK